MMMPLRNVKLESEPTYWKNLQRVHASKVRYRHFRSTALKLVLSCFEETNDKSVAKGA